MKCIPLYLILSFSLIFPSKGMNPPELSVGFTPLKGRLKKNKRIEHERIQVPQDSPTFNTSKLQ